MNLFDEAEDDAFLESSGPLQQVRVKKSTLNCSSGVFTVASYPIKGTDLRVVPDVMKLRYADISFSVNPKNASSLVVKFCGIWTIWSSPGVNVQVIYTKATDQFKIAANPSRVEVDSKFLDNYYLPEFYYLYKAGFTSFSTSGMISGDSVMLQLKTIKKHKKFYILYHKPIQEKARTALALDVSKVEVRCLPFTTRTFEWLYPAIIEEVGVTFSNDGVTGLRPDEFTGSEVLSQHTSNGTIPDGVSATLKFKDYKSPIKISVTGEASSDIEIDRFSWFADNKMLIRKDAINHYNITLGISLPLGPEIKFPWLKPSYARNELFRVIIDIRSHC